MAYNPTAQINKTAQQLGAVSAKVNPKPIAPVLPQAPSYKARELPTALPQFETQRRLAQQRLQAGANQQQDALTRKFAQLGGGPSGASIKAQSNLANDLARQQEEALGGISMAEQQALQGLQQAEQEREFQSGQADVARQMQAEQFGKQFGQQEIMDAFQRKMAQDAAMSQKEADLFNQAIATSELGGGKGQRFLESYKQLGGRRIKNIPGASTYVPQQGTVTPQGALERRGSPFGGEFLRR